MTDFVDHVEQMYKSMGTVSFDQAMVEVRKALAEAERRRMTADWPGVAAAIARAGAAAKHAYETVPVPARGAPVEAEWLKVTVEMKGPVNVEAAANRRSGVYSLTLVHAENPKQHTAYMGASFCHTFPLGVYYDPESNLFLRRGGGDVLDVKLKPGTDGAFNRIIVQSLDAQQEPFAFIMDRLIQLPPGTKTVQIKGLRYGEIIDTPESTVVPGIAVLIRWT